MTALWVALAVVVVVATALWLWWTANRLDRMHHRIEVARATLSAQLLRRSGVTLELAASEALDPASRLVLLDAAHHARNAGPEEMETSESVLSEALRAVFSEPEDVRSLRADPEFAPLVDELAGCCAKVELARRFHNDVVVPARALRSRRRVRLFHLAGHAAELQTVDLDDVPPPALVGP
ncbi:MAG: hypothetical protein QOF53_2054 [Nocardioidaceae bacterium]|jgi:hypothetical protein|nr:hypothetical protein [Nocardioidaceae bacterium]